MTQQMYTGNMSSPGINSESDSYIRPWEIEQENNQIRVQIFGSHYTIKGDANPEYISELARFVNGKMDEVSRQISSGNAVKVAILAALNIADEYFQHRELCDQEIANVEKKTNHMIELLDQGLIGDIY